MTRFKPEQPAGVLFDAKGRVVYRFGNFNAGEWYEVPDYIDGFHGVRYGEGPANPGPTREAGTEERLPDPTPPDDKQARQRPSGINNPQADRFEGTRK